MPAANTREVVEIDEREHERLRGKEDIPVVCAILDQLGERLASRTLESAIDASETAPRSFLH